MAILRLHGILKEESGFSVVAVRGNNLEEVLENLPGEIKKSIEKYKKHVIVLVNGKRVYEYKETLLSEEDVIDLTLVVGGG
ncbi:MAG: MoaD/ThiS family protein [Sulfolobales archaeon]